MILLRSRQKWFQPFQNLWRWYLTKTKINAFFGNATSTKLLFLGNPGQLVFLTFLFVSFANPILKEFFACVFNNFEFFFKIWQVLIRASANCEWTISNTSGIALGLLTASLVLLLDGGTFTSFSCLWFGLIVYTRCEYNIVLIQVVARQLSFKMSASFSSLSYY